MSDASTSSENVIITCFNCTLQIQRTVHIKCAECPVNVCILCFQFGAESGSHRRGHNYVITDPFCASASCGEWGYIEESLLLKSAHQFKMGNWGVIVESMGGNRREALEAKEYFDKVFIRGWMGQYAIKNCEWERIKYEMFKNGTLESVLKANSAECAERLLMIRDALLESDTVIDPKDPKVMTKVQNLLENYVKRCMEGKIEIRWERPKIPGSYYETEISSDECDPAEENFKFKASKKSSDFFGLDPEDESDLDAPPARKKPTNKKKSNQRRLLRDTSSDTERDESPANDVDSFHGLEREADEENSDENTECDEEAEVVVPGTSSTVRRKKRKRIRLWLSKRERQLKAYRVKMNSEHRKRDKDLKKLSQICPPDEMKELRNALPRLALEKRATDKTDKLRIRQDDLRMVGYNVDREEFENEWFNDAENLISRLTINPAPAEKDILLDIENDIKFARIQNYIRIQGIRRAKRNAILEHEKIPQFFNFIRAMTLDKRRPIDVINDRSETEALLAKTHQFLTAEDFKTLTDAIQDVEKLKNRIATLQEMQRNGETTLKNTQTGSSNGVGGWRRGRKKMRKIEKDMNRRASLKWAQFQRWHKSAV